MKKRCISIALLVLSFCEDAECAANLQNEVKRQGIIRKLIEKFIKHDKIKDEIHALLKNANEKEDLFIAGMLSGSLIFEEDGESKQSVSTINSTPCLTQFEVDTLWMKGSSGFMDNLAVYISGKLFGFRIFSKYFFIEAKGVDKILGSIARSSDTQTADDVYLGLAVDRKYLKDICKELYTTLASDPENRYLSFVISKVISNQTNSSVNKQLADDANIAEAKALNIAVESEYALMWLDAYIANSNEREKYEHKLKMLKPEALRLAALRALNRSGAAYPKALAAYTLASTKEQGLCSELNALVEFLIKNKQAQAFEVFLQKNGAVSTKH
jgi:hypothetical protein